MQLTGIRIGDSPHPWRALGFEVADRCVALGGVTLALDPAHGPGITGWSLPELDGLPHVELAAAAPAEHPNGAIALDHVVALTPDFDRTAAAFAAAGLPFRRVRDAPGGFRQGFRRCGPAIVEVVEAAGAPPGPARLWGLVPIVEDLDAIAEQLGPELISPPKPAVQPGRRIATVRRSAELSAHVAFITPERRT